MRKFQAITWFGRNVLFWHQSSTSKILRHLFSRTLARAVFVFNLIFFADEIQAVSAIAIIPFWILKQSIANAPYLQTILFRQMVRLTSWPVAECNLFPITNPMETIIKTKIRARCPEVFTLMPYNWHINFVNKQNVIQFQLNEPSFLISRLIWEFSSRDVMLTRFMSRDRQWCNARYQFTFKTLIRMSFIAQINSIVSKSFTIFIA